ncbi:gluconate 2-dehydrogenase subunit 3 family protein [Dyella sp.]|jgi:gluconate 2-dehydrogenase gamma chain|uniref:gluconate 2-dehydrogenase subunit 3 family protein n=1 Tax=Dyella sp. TaxID=1869338 RepID=UPI002FD9140E
MRDAMRIEYDSHGADTVCIARRHFLAASVTTLSALLFVGCSTSGPPVSATKYFTSSEMRFVRAAVSRLIPADDLGPGALEAGVPEFIDSQLAGSFGRASSSYMQGPWHLGTEQQGYQLSLTPSELYRTAIPLVDAYCKQQHGAVFADLPAAKMDEVLHTLEKGDVPMAGLPKDTFFHALLANTKEGFFADPIYGGNRNFIGWKLIGFPGPRYNYLGEIGKFGQPYEQPFVSLGGRTPKEEA